MKSQFEEYLHCYLIAKICSISKNDSRTQYLAPFIHTFKRTYSEDLYIQIKEDSNSYIIENKEQISSDVLLNDLAKQSTYDNKALLFYNGTMIARNPMEQIEISIDYKQNDELLAIKKETFKISIQPQKFLLSFNTSSMSFQKCLGFLRFVLTNTEKELSNLQTENKIKIEEIPYITESSSLTLEQKCLEELSQICKEKLSKYQSNLTNDLILAGQVQDNDIEVFLNYQELLCCNYRIAQKQILQQYVDFADLMISIFDMSKKNLRKISVKPTYSMYSKYIMDNVLPLSIK